MAGVLEDTSGSVHAWSRTGVTRRHVRTACEVQAAGLTFCSSALWASWSCTSRAIAAARSFSAFCVQHTAHSTLNTPLGSDMSGSILLDRSRCTVLVLGVLGACTCSVHDNVHEHAGKLSTVRA